MKLSSLRPKILLANWASDPAFPAGLRKGLFFFTTFYIAINPFPHTTTLQEISFYSATALFTLLFLLKREELTLSTPFFLPAILFAGWALLGLVGALDRAHSLHDVLYHLVKYFIVYLLIVNSFNTKEKVVLLLYLLVASIVCVNLINLADFYLVEGKSILARFSSAKPHATVGNVGLTSCFSFFITLFLLETSRSWRSRIFLYGALFILAGTILATQTRSFILALPIAFLVFSLKSKKMFALFLLLYLLILTPFVFNLRYDLRSDGYSPRMTLNYISLMLIKENPLSGIGFGLETYGNEMLIDHKKYLNMVPEKFRNVEVQINNPHNEWLGIAVRTGIVGLALFLYLVFSLTRTCVSNMVSCSAHLFNRRLSACAVALLVLFLVYGAFNAFFVHTLELYFAVIFALAALAGMNLQSSSQDWEQQACSP